MACAESLTSQSPGRHFDSSATSSGSSVSGRRSSMRGGSPNRPICGMPGPRSNSSMSRNRATNSSGGTSRYTAATLATSCRTRVGRLRVTAEPRSSSRTSSAEKPIRSVSSRSTGHLGSAERATTTIGATALASRKRARHACRERSAFETRDETFPTAMATRVGPAADHQAEPGRLNALCIGSSAPTEEWTSPRPPDRESSDSPPQAPRSGTGR